MICLSVLRRERKKALVMIQYDTPGTVSMPSEDYFEPWEQTP